ncbi:class I fructose-bisphosphate aldolase [Thiobacillus sp.]
MSIFAQELAKTVAELTTPGKGILAADESAGTIEKRFQAVNVASTEEARRDYRELLFSTPGLDGFISGVILFEETPYTEKCRRRSASKVTASAGHSARHQGGYGHGADA